MLPPKGPAGKTATDRFPEGQGPYRVLGRRIDALGCSGWTCTTAQK